jgi:rRNA maturation endonuclease Nob1
MSLKIITDHLPTINQEKRSSNFCINCILPNTDFKNIFSGYCEKCGKKAMLMTIKDSKDDIDQKYYNDIGGEG